MDANQFKTASLVVRLGNVVAWLRNQRMQQRGITSSQSDVIRYILKHRDQPVSAGDLMEQLGLSPSTMAGILKRLENKSLITRTTDEKDGRKVLIAPTREGMELEDYLKETARQTEEILLRGMTKAEQDEFYRLLKMALQNADAVKKAGGANKMGENQELFEQTPVPKALAALAVPTIISQLITMIYNLADTYFIGKTNNPYQIAAASLAYVLVFVMTALSNLFGVGGGSLISRLLGVQKREQAKCVCAFSFYGAIAVALLYSMGCWVFMDPLLRLLGASDSTIGFSASYAFWVVVVGGIPSTLSMTMAQLLRSEGYAKKASFGLGMGGVLNILLDPVFMFVILSPGQEVAGAGMATMLSNVISLGYFLLVFFRLGKDTVLSLSIHRLPAGTKYAAPVLSVGFPSALSSLLACISNMTANHLASGYGDIPVAAMGLVKKINMLPMNVGMGLCQGMLPLVAYNYAAKQYKRMQSVINCARFSGMGFAVLCIIAFELFSGQIVSLFIQEPETLALSSVFLQISSLATPFMISNFQMAYTLQAMGKGPESLLLSSCRQGIIYIPLMFLMNVLFQLYGVVWAQLLADGLTLVLSFVVYRRVCRQFAE